MRKYKYWTTSEKKFVEENPMMTDKQLAKALGREWKNVHAFRRRLGLKKPSEFFVMVKKDNVKLGGGRPIKKN